MQCYIIHEANTLVNIAYQNVAKIWIFHWTKNLKIEEQEQ